MRFQTDIFLIYLNLFRYIERQKSVYFYKLRHRNWLSTLKRLNVSEKGRYVRPGVNHIIGATVHKILQFEKSSEKVSNWNCGKRGQKSNDFTPSADIRNPRGTSLAIRHTQKFQPNRSFLRKIQCSKLLTVWISNLQHTVLHLNVDRSIFKEKFKTIFSTRLKTQQPKML